MSDFVPGQRWVVDSEPELGLGIVVSMDARAVSLAFPQAECERMYARQKAPLTRIRFDVGDEIHLSDGSRGVVEHVHEHAGMLIYDIGAEQLVPESSLSGEIKMNQPFLRLLTGQIDSAKWFTFRRQLDQGIAKTWQSQLGGLLGVRASLIPHQLYVADTACHRDSVRVLLADEVGLGKTLEAGMILARMLRFERVQRVMILIPDALQVQWLVELIRRFNLHPDLYAQSEHDFASGQLHLIPHSAVGQDDRLSEAASEFDMVIVDEAHHLSPGSDQFDVLRHLASTCQHMVLLSATPEQLGVESHFARLQLLDPVKFADLQDFVDQEEMYVRLNNQIKALPESKAELIAEYNLPEALDDSQVLDHLLDCHGVGRVMFRNTRASVKGFPSRKAVTHELDDDEWESKYEWLAGFIRSCEDKILVICHQLEQVQECEGYLWQKHGIHVALFHEQMDLIERDSAAAYFAEEDGGAQVLLCSEIGSEGRNFQFSHHLVCLDLPDHPDLLEQRIGRLDRIGQLSDVNIHIPYGPSSATWEKLYWFHEILRCIDRQSPAAGAVHDEYWSKLDAESSDAELQSLHQAALEKLNQLELSIQSGRDALLERNSCRQPQAQNLLSRIDQFEEVTPFALVERASELFHFHFEESMSGIYSLIPADNMLIESLPGIPSDGVEVTFSRSLANAREDVMFLTWDSPFVIGLWEILHHSDLGSASVALLPSQQLPAGKCLLESSFDLIIQSPHRAACLSFLDELSVRVLVLDISEKDLSSVLPEESFNQSLQKVDKHLARKIILSRKDALPDWYHKAEGFAEVQKEALASVAVEKIQQHFALERARLESLAAKNPMVSDTEVAALITREEEIVKAIECNMQMQLSAVRLVVTTKP